MLNDALIVARKELLELLMPEGRFAGGAKNLIIIIGLAGLLFPLQAGADWLTSWGSVYSACFPAILLVNYAADTFAGERERHTLETLLASRLPDSAILVGKVGAIVGFGWALILVAQAIAVVALNVVHGHGRLIFFEPVIAVSMVVLAVVLPLLLTTVGIVMSMTAPTVRSAGQRIMLPFMAIYGLPALAPFLARKLGWTPNLETLTPWRLFVGFSFVAFAISVVLLVVARRMFKREKLVLC